MKCASNLQRVWFAIADSDGNIMERTLAWTVESDKYPATPTCAWDNFVHPYGEEISFSGSLGHAKHERERKAKESEGYHAVRVKVIIEPLFP